MAKSHKKSKRIALWSVPGNWISVYFVLFTVMMVFIMVCILWSHFGEPPAFVRHIIEVTALLSSLTIGVVAITYIFTEVFRMLSDFVMEKYLERRFKKGVLKGQQEGLRKGREEGQQEGFRKGREDGIAKERQSWMAWNERRLSAEAENRPFDEPPPA